MTSLRRVSKKLIDCVVSLKTGLKYRFIGGSLFFSFLKQRLTVDNLSMLKWYVDGSHNVHRDCRGHGGAVFSLGRGATSSYSRKIKLNTRSSTETELVTADMFMPEMLWSLHFIQAQGYETECVGLYQDNISTQLLIKNGKMSSGKKTKKKRKKKKTKKKKKKQSSHLHSNMLIDFAASAQSLCRQGMRCPKTPTRHQPCEAM